MTGTKWLDLTPDGWLCRHLRNGVLFPYEVVERNGDGAAVALTFAPRGYSAEWCPKCGWVDRKGGE